MGPTGSTEKDEDGARGSLQRKLTRKDDGSLLDVDETRVALHQGLNVLSVLVYSVHVFSVRTYSR